MRVLPVINSSDASLHWWKRPTTLLTPYRNMAPRLEELIVNKHGATTSLYDSRAENAPITSDCQRSWDRPIPDIISHVLFYFSVSSSSNNTWWLIYKTLGFDIGRYRESKPRLVVKSGEKKIYHGGNIGPMKNRQGSFLCDVLRAALLLLHSHCLVLLIFLAFFNR